MSEPPDLTVPSADPWTVHRLIRAHVMIALADGRLDETAIDLARRSCPAWMRTPSKPEDPTSDAFGLPVTRVVESPSLVRMVLHDLLQERGLGHIAVFLQPRPLGMDERWNDARAVLLDAIEGRPNPRGYRFEDIELVTPATVAETPPEFDAIVRRAPR